MSSVSSSRAFDGSQPVGIGAFQAVADGFPPGVRHTSEQTELGLGLLPVDLLQGLSGCGTRAASRIFVGDVQTVPFQIGQEFPGRDELRFRGVRPWKATWMP